MYIAQMTHNGHILYEMFSFNPIPEVEGHASLLSYVPVGALGVLLQDALPLPKLAWLQVGEADGALPNIPVAKVGEPPLESITVQHGDVVKLLIPVDIAGVAGV